MICRDLKPGFVPLVVRKFEKLNVWGNFLELGFWVFFLLKISRAFSCKMIWLEFKALYITKIQIVKNEEWSLKIEQIVVSWLCFFFEGLWCYVIFCSSAIVNNRMNKFVFCCIITWEQFWKSTGERLNFLLPVSITNV